MIPNCIKSRINLDETDGIDFMPTGITSTDFLLNNFKIVRTVLKKDYEDKISEYDFHNYNYMFWRYDDTGNKIYNNHYVSPEMSQVYELITNLNIKSFLKKCLKDGIYDINIIRDKFLLHLYETKRYDILQSIENAWGYPLENINEFIRILELQCDIKYRIEEKYYLVP